MRNRQVLGVPASPRDLTADWLSAALKAGDPSLPPIESVVVEPLDQGMGVTTQILRLSLTYRAGGEGPATLIAKMATTAPAMREAAVLFGFYQREVSFYRTLATSLPIATPRCYAAAIEPATHAFVLVLEDLSAGLKGDQVAGLTLAQAELAIDRLADLHADQWNRSDLAVRRIAPPLGEPPYSNFKTRHQAAWSSFECFIDARRSPLMRQVGARLADALDGLIKTCTDGPLTLCHGDFRADNLIFGARDVTALDWQMTTHATGAFDVGYLLSGSVDSGLRQRREFDLLRRYHSRLTARGVAGYDFDLCRRHYRCAVLIAFTYCVQGGAASDLTHPRTAALFDCMVRRCEAAVEDLSLLELIG
jgi:hypothetical protein